VKTFMLVGCIVALAISSAQAADDSELQLQNRLRAHIEFLADDLMLGRQPGSDGYNIAANYVSSQFRQMGLQPAGDDGSYLQQVPLRRAYLEPGSAQLAFINASGTTPLGFIDEFYMGPALGSTSSDVEAGLIFVGYGIEAGELEHNDYSGLDVEGKIVVLFSGQPHDFPSEEGAHFASRTEKTVAAVRHGAVGVLMIHTPRASQRYDWDRVTSGVGSPSMGWLNKQGEVHGVFEQIQGGAMVRHSAAGPLFENAPVSLEALLVSDDNGEALTTFDLEGSVRMRQKSTHETIYSPNVVAVLPGSDPLIANEYVVYSAHLDHIGELHSEGDEQNKKDLINNGALDNASGVAVMLETAQLFTERETPRRSILFVAVTAEEKGLVGSEYFAMNPTVPQDSIVAEINLDMPLLLYEFADVIAFGAEHSSIGTSAKVAAQSYDTELSPDPFPDQNLFVRSDHYSFVKQGIPSVYLVTGVRSLDETVDTQPIFEGFLKDHYHKPSDDVSLPINYKAAAKFTRINTKIGELLANDPNRPTWHEGDFFGRTFAK